MKFLRILAVLVGLAIAALLVRRVGAREVWHSLGLLRWGYVWVLLYPASWCLLNTAGWRSALTRPVSFWLLAAARVAGESFNSLLPSGYIGGEPLKAKFLAREVPLREAVSSVIIAKAGQSVALVPFVALGLTVGAAGRPSALRDPRTLIALLALSIGIGVFIWLLAHHSFSRLGRWLHRLTGHPWFQKQNERLTALDVSLGEFYRRQRFRFAACVLWHAAGWMAGAFEVSLIFFLMGSPVTWRQAWFIGAMAQFASVIGLAVPAGIGLYEGGHYMAASLLGLDPALGLTVSLVRRVREIVWDAFGLFLFWFISRRPS